MTLIHVASAPIRRSPDFPTEGRVGVIRDVTARLFYFSLIATVFAFVLILTIGTHP
jgi:hypothetical protein